MIKWLLSYFIVFCSYTALHAQVEFRTLVTPGPVVVDEPFQVQYVLENIDEKDEFIPPKFKYFELVSGPNIYIGSITTNGSTRNLRNMIYTLAAIRPGKFMVPGATARINGKIVHSDNAAIEVISKDEAIKRGFTDDEPLLNQEHYLRPGEDPYEKIRRNLFMKVVVDRKSCYVGQPVTATFKLYSRLKSRSDIVKNPGLYGFTVQDIINLNDRHIEKEVVNGKKYDVHTIRKVQLYPLRAGTYTIDQMELQNKVAFSKTAIRKKTEQEIVEGIFADPDDYSDPNTVSYENNMHSEPINIEVKPVPVANQPIDFNGATGNFKIQSGLSKNIIAGNEEAELKVEINGRGNFTQLVAPELKWPAGMEGFEPEVKDSLDHNFSPMQGSRTFRYRIVATTPGKYTIPAVSFSFFDPDSNRYRTVTTKPVSLTVNNQLNDPFLKKPANIIRQDKKTNYPKLVMLIAAILLLFAAGLVLLRKRLKKSRKPLEQPISVLLPTINQLLYNATILSQSESGTFYSVLRTAIWNFLNAYFDLNGSRMNKNDLIRELTEKKVGTTDREQLLQVLQECETNIFTQVDSKEDHHVKLELTRELLERIKRSIV